ncbi:Glutamyl-tRNA reductase [Fulvivirga imtechensis AK7]|uniref:Glutamyl-tRNA reductase n=1 Tax=Fulvivirga imtechensis AK7 TaxID=1237149 RepID=L8JJX9_9BACT|nr:glutamyl-tRNA reductase [Fulvivirga imtechensis]ELR69115.1 Glutamyl-tRNA reductase [Fulvivirga imtechensis AK7]
MQETFKVLGLSFKNTPILVREKLALDEGHAKKLMKFIRDYTQASDVLVLSTCNRTEVYYNSNEDLTKEILNGISLIKGVDESAIAEYFISYSDHEGAVQRLFDVSMGLEAQVVGDLQISNQVKKAYQWSADENMAGPFLHRLMHTIFFTNKRVVQETSFRDGAASVSYATKELVEDITAKIQDPRVLILGLGEIGRDVCRNLVDSKLKNIVIANRTEEKALAMAKECNFQTVSFDNITAAIQDADVIISSIAAEQPFITKELAEKLEILSFKFFIDLSVPRSVEVAIEDVPGALVYNIDSIQNKASEALEKRTAAIPDVQRIITEAIADFNDWSKEMIVSPTIKKLKNALEDIRKEELARYLKDTDSKEAKIIDTVTKSMMQKIMKLPVLQLKAACKRGDAETLIDVLHDLFDLEKQSTESK